jgi:WD40 repeat protein
MKNYSPIILTLFFMFLVACSSQTSEDAVQTAIQLTDNAKPTYTPTVKVTETDTPFPTLTYTPKPSPTPLPTSTFTPSVTPTPSLIDISPDNASILASFAELEIQPLSSIWETHFSTAGDQISVFVDGYMFYIYDWVTQEKITTLELNADGAFRGYVVSPSLRIVAIYRDNGVELFDTATGTSIQYIQLKNRPNDISFSADETTLAIANLNGLFLWSIDRKQLIATLDDGSPWDSVQLSHDDNFLFAIACDKKGGIANCRNPKMTYWNIQTEEIDRQYRASTTQDAKYTLVVSTLDMVQTGAKKVPSSFTI